MPHGILRLNRDRAVGRSHHLQDAAQLGVPAGHEQHLPQLWTLLRNRPGRLPLLHAGHGQGTENVPIGAPVVDSGYSILHCHLHLRRGWCPRNFSIIRIITFSPLQIRKYLLRRNPGGWLESETYY